MSSLLWLVSGTRDLSSAGKQIIHTTLTAAWLQRPPQMLMHGMAPGVDTFVEEWLAGTVPVIPMGARWSEMGDNAGPMRNMAMVAAADRMRFCLWDVRVFAFPGPNSRGTYNLKKHAEGNGFIVEETGVP